MISMVYALKKWLFFLSHFSVLITNIIYYTEWKKKKKLKTGNKHNTHNMCESFWYRIKIMTYIILRIVIQFK